MGVVYKARDTKLDRDVALKFLPPNLGLDEQANRRFMQEAKAASALDHPNICTIYEVGEANEDSALKGRLFIAMAFYNGRTLKQVLEEDDRLKPADAVNLTIQIAEGLAIAHARGIVHRDIKPANIIVTEDGLVKILDFGLAKLAGGMALTKSGSTLGTAGYMAPEQVRAEAVDHRADLWSLGVVLYHMLSGKKPFEGQYEQAIAYSILNETPEIPETVSNELRAILERLLEKDPSARFGAASDVAAALGRVPEVKPAAPITEPEPEQPRRWMAAGGILAVIAVALLAWLLMRPDASGAGESIDPNAIAVMPFTVRGDPDLEYLGEGLVDLLSVKFDGAGTLRSVDANAILGTIAKEEVALETPDDALLLARRLGAGRVIVGNVVRIGREIRLSASLYTDNAEPEVTASTTVASEDELTASLDGLALEIVGGLLKDPGDELKSLAAITTTSLPAMKDYLKGEQALRRGEWDKAVAELNSAVEKDSTFALAWSRLAFAAGWTADVLLEFRALDEALDRRESLPERMQKLVEADYYGFRDGDAERAFDLYRQVLSRHRNDVYALQKLGEMLYHYNPLLARSQAEAGEYFERALSVAPDRGDNRIHLLDLAAEEGRYAEVDSLAEVVLGSNPDPEMAAVTEAVRGMMRRADGDSSWSFELTSDLTTSGIITLGQIASTELEDIPAARQIAEAGVREDLFPEAFRQEGYVALSVLAAAEGKLHKFDSLLTQAGPRFVARRIVRRALVYALPIYPATDSLLRSVHTEVVDWDTLSNPIYPPTVDWNLFEGDYHVIKAYLLGLLALRLGDRDEFEQRRAYLGERADLNADEKKDEKPRRGHGPHLAYSLLRTLDALGHWNETQLEEALEAAEQARMRILWRASGLSMLYGQVLRRLILAELLLEAGRLEESHEAFRSLTAAGYLEGAYFLGTTYIRLAEIHERLDDREKAVEYYARLLRLWKNCDPELIPIREAARRNFDRLLEDSVREPPSG